jgi:hypothetical protein
VDRLVLQNPGFANIFYRYLQGDRLQAFPENESSIQAAGSLSSYVGKLN